MADEDKILNTKEKEEPKPLVMTITLHPTKGCLVSFPLMPDKVISYGTLKVAGKALDEFYAKDRKIVQPKGGFGIMDFVRNRKRFK